MPGYAASAALDEITLALLKLQLQGSHSQAAAAVAAAFQVAQGN